MGMNAGPLRLPLTEMDDSNVARLKKSLADYGLKVAEGAVIKFNDLTKD